MKTIEEILKLSASFLEERGIERSRRTAEDLLSHLLHMKRLELYLQFDRPLLETEIAGMRELVKKCGKGEPFEYVVGEMEFLGCKLKIDRRALIPRPETEFLAEKISKEIETGVVWDICTGSGCIGIALKKIRPALTVVLSDLSPEALSLARENAQGVDVEILPGDLWEPFRGRKADVIVCNPPYISEKEYLSLDPSVRDFEPRQALVGGRSGTEIYERLQREFAEFLNPGGRLYLEIGSNQGEAIKKIFHPEGELLFDYAGHPRYFVVKKIF